MAHKPAMERLLPKARTPRPRPFAALRVTEGPPVMLSEAKDLGGAWRPFASLMGDRKERQFMVSCDFWPVWGRHLP